MSANLERALGTLQQARSELAARSVRTDELDGAIGQVQRDLVAGADLPPEREPYFIPNDLSLCTPTSILNCSHVDRELDLPAGFSIEAAATAPHTFAKPYYIDPVAGVRRCQGLFALERYTDRRSWKYDLSFVGHEGKFIATDQPAAVPANLRYLFLNAFARDYLPSSDARIRFHRNRTFFFSDPTEDTAQRKRRNDETDYISSVRDSRFVLCPRGGGPHSIRFFESLACANIPVYIGETTTRFPLDWIINWPDACFRIGGDEIEDGRYRKRLDEILATPVAETNRRREYIFRIYHQFLAPERKPVFEELVLTRVRHLLRSSSDR